MDETQESQASVRDQFKTPKKTNDNNNNSGGSGGYGSGGSSSGKTKTTDVSRSKNTTYNKTNVTTTTRNNLDTGAQENLDNRTRAEVDFTIDDIAKKREFLDTNILTNANIAALETKENARNASDSALAALQDEQAAYHNLRSSSGNGAYGSDLATRTNLTARKDDQNDQSILNQQRKTQNEIYEDQYSKNASLVNDFNEGLLSSYATAVQSILNNWADSDQLLGSTTVSDNVVDEKQVSKGKSKKVTTSKYNTSGNNTTYKNTSKETGTTRNVTTGNNSVTNTTTTDKSRADTLEGLMNVLGINLTGLTENAIAPALQEQARYRTAEDKVFANAQKYAI